MLSNYLTIISRNLWRNKAFSAINIFGLSIGIATCLIILLYVQHELSYDRYNEKADRICRVTFQGSVQGEAINEPHVMPPTAQTLKADYPEVEDATRLRVAGSPAVRYQDKTFRDDQAAHVDANFFQVFTLPFLQGDAKTALLQPNTVVISKQVAEKYFGKEDPIGKVLNFESWNTPYTVTGVMANMPVNSHFHFDLFTSMEGFPDAKSNSWMMSEFYTYLLLRDGKALRQLEGKLPQVVEKYMGPQLQQAMGMSLEAFKNKGYNIGLYLQTLTDIHLHSQYSSDLGLSGNIEYVYIFSAIALFMLLIACINFMNLSTAGASKRAREVGIRKVLGSVKVELVRQFLLESLLLTLIAFMMALGYVWLVLPFFNDFTGIELSLNPAVHPWLLPGLLAIGLFTGLIAGSYPAFFLSSFQPITVLKGRFTAGKKSLGLRSGLVVFQFFISIALIMCTLVVYRQLSFIQNKQLGYDKTQVLVLPEAWMLGKQLDVFRNQLTQDPRVLHVSTSGYLPAGNSYNNNFFVSPEHNSSQLLKTLRYDVDEEYLETLGMKLISGRNFSKEFGNDSTGVILNESAAKALGWEKDALDRVITRSDNEGKQRAYRVIGVVADFHFKSLHEPISPLVMVLGYNEGNIIVKAKTADIAGLIRDTENRWKALASSEPFSYSFLDDRFNSTYQAEQKIGLLLGIFAGLTIFVACLGLFGLAMFTTEQRVKEIGVRKVLGASVAGITGLLAKDFLKLVLIAVVIAAPVAWWAMSQWLAGFAYRIAVPGWLFVLAGLLAVVVAFLTVGFQSVKAAVANPVRSLRNE